MADCYIFLQKTARIARDGRDTVEAIRESPLHTQDLCNEATDEVGKVLPTLLNTDEVGKVLPTLLLL